MTELGNQPNPYRPLPPTDGTIRCAACHEPLLVPPAGATAGLCPGLACIQPDRITADTLRDFNHAMRMVLSGRMTAELEPETLVTWLTQVPPKPRPPHPVAYDDDGFQRFLDTGSPHGQTIRPEVDTLIGDDPRLDRYRKKVGDDGE